MSVETVLGNIALRVGIDDTSLQISDNSFEVRLLNMFINEAGKDISRRASWSKMHKEFTTAGSVNEDTLPADFQRLDDDTPVRLNKSTYQPVRGVVSTPLFSFLRNNTSSQNHFMIVGDKIKFSSTLDSDGAIVSYISSEWVVGKDGVTQNSDEFKLPERLIEKGVEWRWNRFHGLPFDDLLAEYESDILEEIKSDRGSK